MANNIVSVPVVTVVPPRSQSTGSQPGDNNQNTASGSTQNPTGGSQDSQNVNQSQSSQSGDNSSANTTGSTTGNNSNFENVLTAAKSSGQSSGNQKGANDNGSSDTGNNTPVGNIAQALIAVQSELLNVTNGSGGTTADGTSPASAALQQLQQILQTLLQQATALGKSGGANTAADNTTTPQQNTNNGKTSGDNPLTDALSQLLAIVAQIQPALQTGGTVANSATLTSEIQNVTDTLTQLSGTLAAGLGTTTGNTADNNTADLANAVSSVSSAFNQMLENFLGNAAGNGSSLKSAITQLDNNNTNTAFTNSVNALQSALSRILAIVEPTQNTKQDSGSDSDSGSGNSNISAASQVVSNAANTTQQSAGSDFVKLTNGAQQPNTPVSDQVLVQIKNAAETGQSQIKIQLEPADLGKVEVQMTTGSDGKTGVTITANNRQTLTMLQSDARSLESALRNIGIKTDAGGLNFNLRGQGQNGGNSGGNQGGYTHVATTNDDDDDSYVGAVTTSYQLSVQSGLDIRV